VREDSSHADKAARLKALREAVHLHFGAAGGEYVLPSQQVRPPVELATVHKAKGLGWPVVYLKKGTCSSRPRSRF